VPTPGVRTSRVAVGDTGDGVQTGSGGSGDSSGVACGSPAL
jgi:hypothetical protein